MLAAAHGLVAGAPEPFATALGTLVDWSGVFLVALAVAGLGIWRERSRNPRAQRAATSLGAAAAVLLGVWLLLHPSDGFDELFGRWDHLAFAGMAGLAIASLPPLPRKYILAALGAGFLLQYAGAAALGMAGALTLVAILLWRTPLRASRRAMIAAQGALVVGAYAALFWLRAGNPSVAAGVQGLLAFWVLRHISLVVTAVRAGGVPSLADCGAFMTFYPGAMRILGGPEVYDEFARRNLAHPPVLRHQRAVRHIAEGALLATASQLVPITLARVEASGSAGQAWGWSIGLFVHTALGLMGLWRVVDGTALFYGVQLRANFAGLLSCRNPSELWWSWRGSLTNWLVRYVYAPLGGAQRHQSLNIAAAFAVSFLWHAMGVPFLVREFRPAQVLPVALWAGINATAVIAQVNIDRAGWRSPAIVPGWARAVVATVSIWALGSLNITLLSYQGSAVSGFPHLLRLLLGLR